MARLQAQSSESRNTGDGMHNMRSIIMRIATLNIGTLNEREDAVADAMRKRNIDILCLQETKIGDGKEKAIDENYKLYCSLGDKTKYGVAICISKEWQDKIETKNYLSDRIMSIRLQTTETVLSIVSVYAPQQNLGNAKKTEFWTMLRQVTEKIPWNEELIIAGDLNGHVGADGINYSRWHGGYSRGRQNKAGEKILNFVSAFDLALVNTFFCKDDSHTYTYYSKKLLTVVDYLACRRNSLGMIRDCEVKPEELIASQHKLLVMDVVATNEDQAMHKIYNLPKTKQEQSHDIYRLALIKDDNGEIRRDSESIKKRWMQYFKSVMKAPQNEGILQYGDGVEDITELEITKQICMMTSTILTQPIDISIGDVKMLGDSGINWAVDCLQQVLAIGEIPNEWKHTKIIPTLARKGDPMDCNNYNYISASSYLLTLLENVMAAKLKETFNIGPRSPIESIFHIRRLQEKYRGLHIISVKPERDYHTISCTELKSCLSSINVPMHYIYIINEIYSNRTAQVVTSVGETSRFEIKFCLYQGSVLSKLLLDIIINATIEKNIKSSKFVWEFSGDGSIILCSERCDMLEKRLIKLEKELKRSRLEMNIALIEHLPPPDYTGTIQIKKSESAENAILPKCGSFEYLGTIIQTIGECNKEIEKGKAIGWEKFREYESVMRDTNVPISLKENIYINFIRPALLCTCETLSIDEKQINAICEDESTMLDIIKSNQSEKIRTLIVKRRLSLYGTIKRGSDQHLLNGYNTRSKEKNFWINLVHDDMFKYSLKMDDAMDQNRWEAIVEQNVL